MINHARTLLLNLAPAPSGFYIGPGEEFIDPSFQPLALSAALSQVRAAMFGTDPDRLMLNYRGRQLLGLLHTTELAEFVLELDSRITYDILPRDDLYLTHFIPRVTKLRQTTRELYLSGRVTQPNRAGRLEQSWRIEVISGNTAAIRRQAQPLDQTFSDFIVTDGLSEQIPLPGSGLFVRFEPAVGSAWRVTAASRPGQALTDMEAALTAVQGSLNVLFGVGTPSGAAEPYLTFRNLWHNHPELPYRLGGAVLAWIYRAAEQHQLR